MVEIKILTDRDSPFIDIMTEWCFNEWGQSQGFNKEVVKTTFQNSLCTDRIPLTFVAVEDGKLLGYCNINMFDDLLQYPDIYPWLKNVYVDKPHRGRGESVRLYKKTLPIK